MVEGLRVAELQALPDVLQESMGIIRKEEWVRMANALQETKGQTEESL